MRSPLSVTLAAATLPAAGSAATGSSLMSAVADVQPSEIAPGFGYPPDSPCFHICAKTGDAYLPRSSGAPDAAQYALQNAPQGSAVGSRVFWDCYRDRVSTAVLSNPHTREHLARWHL
ncbi:hypothetical protein [Mycolicibacterium aromaticivorans]|nr:hypothetical protein [Mycolicibacterium aromaticivorans]